MTCLDAIITRNLSANYQNLTPIWWPLNVQLTPSLRRAWLRLPGNRFISYGIEPDYDERLVATWGPFILTRPETDAEREEREEAEAEEAFMEYELNRYTEWYY